MWLKVKIFFNEQHCEDKTQINGLITGVTDTGEQSHIAHKGILTPYCHCLVSTGLPASRSREDRDAAFAASTPGKRLRTGNHGRTKPRG